MAQSLTHGATALPADWRDLFALTKPRVMSLVVFTALCGLLAAPGSVHPVLAFSSILAIALGAGASGALNQWYEAGLDAKMKRTAGRPLPAGRLDPQTALQFGVGLAAFSVFLMLFAANWQAAVLLTVSILFYVFVYTMWLKPRTPQNIVIGGAAGAFPPLIGWVAATGSVAPLPVLLFLLIFLWTPPHFWALALFVRSDYAAAGIPMMPVVAGETSTRRQILFYAVIMAIGAIAPWPLGYAGALYGWTAALLSAVFVALSVQVGTRTTGEGDLMQPEKRLFAFSIAYLFILFGAVVADHWFPL
ncbi:MULTISPECIES: heme o synthase [unclassified Sphingopyxis]|uniref:heme o synthase n=1 Tax=unclassified Sphingopyxis TaxID=2614943 RepID=UPI000730FA75|nr:MULTISPECIES: heme o synthase [unclassified Sphingopyxis]KTE27795.1 protoheme IX farnesyltransferase [Sphingopyxis sp. H057]KTE55824.1 protoheme IX farnesyltransferase [Sphingopyxis sp. H073]KTE56466.1 protoheme IX farnesyltransferase [Sphingopyxis sp. H107]KTE57295.1 protoheme IX farnesyltransferase [Sphingopyxis sp. H071]KTE65286.1 protoheme IX farnesyltransferase [Sphingopyxis sp. H100]